MQTAKPWRALLELGDVERIQKNPITPKMTSATSSTNENSGFAAKKPKSKPGRLPSEPTAGRTPSVSA